MWPGRTRQAASHVHGSGLLGRVMGLTGWMDGLMEGRRELPGITRSSTPCRVHQWPSQQRVGVRRRSRCDKSVCRGARDGSG